MDIGVSFKSAKSTFLDSRIIISQSDKVKNKALPRFGAFVRRRAMSSIRRRKKISNPGKSPTNQTGLLKRTIFFSYRKSEGTVVIGPALLSQKNNNRRALEALEFGGTFPRKINRYKRRVQARYRARPFMGPAYEKEKSNLPRIWEQAAR
jgi:hypothetical protein